MRKFVNYAVIFTLFFIGNAWANETDFKKAVAGYPSAVLVQSAYMPEKDYGAVRFKHNPQFPHYFTTGDKINKIFAIESARFFRKVPGMQGLGIEIVLQDQVFKMIITRDLIERWYQMRMDMNDATWSGMFLRKFDSKPKRAAFVAKFVKGGGFGE